MFKREVHKFPYNAVKDNPEVASVPISSSIHTVVSILHRHCDRETPAIAYTSLCRASKRRVIMQWPGIRPVCPPQVRRYCVETAACITTQSMVPRDGLVMENWVFWCQGCWQKTNGLILIWRAKYTWGRKNRDCRPIIHHISETAQNRGIITRDDNRK